MGQARLEKQTQQGCMRLDPYTGGCVCVKETFTEEGWSAQNLQDGPAGRRPGKALLSAEAFC